MNVNKNKSEKNKLRKTGSKFKSATVNRKNLQTINQLKRNPKKINNQKNKIRKQLIFLLMRTKKH